jgi:hypothetical protein
MFLQGYYDIQPSANGAWPSMVVQSNGDVHAAYNSETQVRYAKRISGAWSSTGITTPSFTGCGGTFSSIAVGASHRPHITYYVVCTSHIYLADWTGSSWQYDVIPDDDIWTDVLSLRLDSSERPCIAYSKAGGIRYAVRTTSGWQIETVPGTDLGHEPSLQLGPAGEPAIAFTQIVTVSGVNLRAPRFARKAGGTWTVESIGPTIVDGSQDIQLQLDAAGAPQVVYGCRVSSSLNSSEWDLMHAVRQSPGVWPSFAIQRVAVPRSADYSWYPSPSFLLDRTTGELHVTFSPELWPVPLEINEDNKIRYSHGILVPPPGGGGGEGGGGCPHCIDPVRAGDEEASGGRLRLLSVNPAGPGVRVVVRLSVPHAQSVDCALYDVFGRRVAASPAPQALSAGVHELKLDRSGDGGGVYFLRLISNSGQRLSAKVFLPH